MEYKGAILAISKITPINNTKKAKRRKEVVFMKFFIDTAIVEEIKKANDMGIICGVTTNADDKASADRCRNRKIYC